MGRANGFSSKKKLKRLHASRAKEYGDEDAEPGLDDGGIDDDDGEPQLAQPARKKARGEASRKSRRGEPQKPAPKPRGPLAAKPQRTPALELDAEALEERRKRNRAYAKKSYKKKRKGEEVPPELEGEAPRP